MAGAGGAGGAPRKALELVAHVRQQLPLVFPLILYRRNCDNAVEMAKYGNARRALLLK